MTFALALLGAVHVGRAFCIFIAQLTGACFAAYLVKAIFPIDLNVSTTLAPGTSIAQGIFIEALCSKYIFLYAELSSLKYD